MASVTATFIENHSSEGSGVHLSCPSSYPTWTSSHRNFLSTDKTTSGFTTTWTTHGCTRLSVTNPHPPSAIALAYFPPLNSTKTNKSIKTSLLPSHPRRNTSLVIASYRFITVATPGEDVVRIPIGDPLTDPVTPTQLFTPPSGIIIYTASNSSYYYLAHPLQQPIPLNFPSQHTLLYAFSDVPLLVSRAGDTLTIWSCLPSDDPIPQPHYEYYNSPLLSPSSSSPSPSLQLSSFSSSINTIPIPSSPRQNVLTVSTLQLTPVYNTSVKPTTRSINAFLSHDVHGLLTLCLAFDSTLTGLSIMHTDTDKTFKISPSFRIRDVTSALPVLAVRRPHFCLDALIRHANGSLSLFMGRNRLCAVTLPQRAFSLLNDLQYSLQQPVSDEFSLLNRIGEGMRFSLENACFLSPLVNDCLAAITFSFEESSTVTRVTALYHDLLLARAQLLSTSSTSTSSTLLLTPSQDIEWSLLENVLLRVVSSDPSTNNTTTNSTMTSTAVTAKKKRLSDRMDVDSYNNLSTIYNLDDFDANNDKNGDDDDDEASDSDWHALLCSDFHEEFTTTSEFSTKPPRPPLHLSDMDNSLISCLPETSLPHTDILKQVLHALHLLYEDRRLRSLCGSTCRQLARLNHRLACILGNFAYIDHYRRDFPDLVAGKNADSVANICGSAIVPSIMDYLSTKMSGENQQKMLCYPVRKFNGRLECPQDTALTATWRKESPFELTQRIINYYNILFDDDDDDEGKDGNNDNNDISNENPGDDADTTTNRTMNRYERVLLAMVKDNVTTADIDELSFGVALPLRDALWNCRQQPNNSWPFSAFALTGREDLFNFSDFDTEAGGAHDGNKEEEENSSLQLVRESRALLQIHAAAAAASTEEAITGVRMDYDEIERDTNHPSSSVNTNNTTATTRTTSNTATLNNNNTSSFVEAKGDGCDMDADIFRLRFSEDKRVNEVRRMLRSTDMIIMRPVQKSEQQMNAGEFDMMAEHKLKLSYLLRKRFAAPVGRGAFTLRTFVPTNPTKPLPVPKICMTAKLFGQINGKVTYEVSDATSFQWGEFHNGVAAGLRIIAADNTNREGGTDQILTRSWIVNHRPSDISGGATHAGMLLALGLGGYLPVLRKTDYIQYLVPRHELTAIGLMLGLSAGNVGCADEKITKMLCLHIRPFNEAGFSVPEFHVSVTVQTSAVLGLGLLHLGSCEHSLLEGLFSELGRKPKPGDAIDNREGLALASGFSIGLLCLGHGASAFDAADRRRIDRLVLYANGDVMMNGRWDTHRKAEGTVVDRAMADAAAAAAAAAAAVAANAAVAESETSRIMEGVFVNSDVISPGALMALALIFMKTNDRRMADRITLPDSHYSLARVRADHVYLRIVTRCLIMWDEIESTEEWIRKTIPALLHPVSSFMDSHDDINDEHDENDLFDLQGRVNINDVIYHHDVDISGILQARAFAIAGACTAIALKFAGTCQKDAVALIIRACEAFERALISPECARARGTMEFVYSTGMCCVSLALGIICAGSGHLEALRLLRRLRKRGGVVMTNNNNSNQNSNNNNNNNRNNNRDNNNIVTMMGNGVGTGIGVGRYGMHMAMHMAIGFLFLGGGCQTFGTSHIAIVGLLCSILPPFPRDVCDNQYHLQAFRHLYVLAVEPRCIETRDVDTGKWCSVDIQLEMKNGHRENLQAPCIVPEAKYIKKLHVVGQRYLRNSIGINRPVDGRGWFSSCKGQVIFVKRRAGHLPFKIDPKGGKGILARSLNRPKPKLISLEGNGNDETETENEDEEKYFKQVQHLVKAFSADPEILAFVKYFCQVEREEDDEYQEEDEIEDQNENDGDDDDDDDDDDDGDDDDDDDDGDDDDNIQVEEIEKCEMKKIGKRRRRKSTTKRRNRERGGTSNSSKSSNGEKEKRYVEMLYDCLSNDKADAVKVYLDLERAVESVQRGNVMPFMVDSLMLCESYMLLSPLRKRKGKRGRERRKEFEDEDNDDDDEYENGLIRTDFVARLLREVRKRMGNRQKVRDALINYICTAGKQWPGMTTTTTTTTSSSTMKMKAMMTKTRSTDEDDFDIDDDDNNVKDDLAASLRLNRFPPVRELAPIAEWLNKIRARNKENHESDDEDRLESLWTGFIEDNLSRIRDSCIEHVIDTLI